MTVTIRDAQLADAPRLTELIIELGHPIEEAQVRANLELLSERSLLPLVATTNGEVVAMCGCKILEITSNVRRERAHQFYGKLGYERTSYRFMKRLA